MTRLARILRQSLTVARRDFVATVFTPTFLLFLLAPIIMMGFGVIGGLGAATMAGGGESKTWMVVIAAPDQAPELAAADKQLRRLFPPRGEDSRPPLRIEAPSHDVAVQARALFDREDFDVAAVLHGPLERPQILYGPRARGEAEYLAQLAEQVLRARKAGGPETLSEATRTVVTRDQASISGRGQLGYIGVFGLFFLTLLLAGQAVGTMAEEKSNKVIEVLAAAVPLESVFMGKLIGTFGVAVLFLIFWGTLATNLASFLPGDIVRAFSDLGPAVGKGAFVLLFAAYFTTSFLLLSAVFLGIGALAGTPREIQLLSLPITVFHVSMFGFASLATAAPGSGLALAAEIFPFSSAFAMIARAANSPGLWPHALAIGWQLLWVAIVIALGARLFRRGVLKSGSPGFRLKGLVGK